MGIMSSGASAFARDGSIARSISGGLHKSASRLGGARTSHDRHGWTQERQHEK